VRDEAVAVAASSQILGRGHRIQAAAKELHAEDAEDQVVDDEHRKKDKNSTPQLDHVADLCLDSGHPGHETSHTKYSDNSEHAKKGKAHARNQALVYTYCLFKTVKAGNPVGKFCCQRNGHNEIEKVESLDQPGVAVMEIDYEVVPPQCQELQKGLAEKVTGENQPQHHQTLLENDVIAL